MILHAGCVARRLNGRWRGVLLTGASGGGKSDLTLRLIGRGWRLVADDHCVLWRSGPRVFARAPETLAGLLEARGVGIVRQPSIVLAEIALHAVCDARPQRLPEPTSTDLLGAAVHRLDLRALESSAPDKLALALFAAVQRSPLDAAAGKRI